MLHLLLEVLVDIPDELGESHLHPLVTVAEECTTVMFAGKSLAVTFVVRQFRHLMATNGCLFVTITLHDFEGFHPLLRFTKHTCAIVVPDLALSKVPNYVCYSRRPLKCMLAQSPVAYRGN